MTEYKLVNRHSITQELTSFDLFLQSNQGEQDQQREKRNGGDQCLLV